jgi:hypothetical protein
MAVEPTDTPSRIGGDMRTGYWQAALAAGAILLGGCAPAASPSARPDPATHTMADGTVMSGESHRHGQHDGGAPDPDPTRPSEAAAMICGGSVADDVARLLSLPAPPDPSSTWDRPMFTCTFHLTEGPLVLAVHDATDPKVGREHFAALRDELGNTDPLKGMYGLGLPAFETPDGTVAFIRDGKTLRVDASELPDGLGADDLSTSELAYAVATSVLACWTAHA